MKRSDVFGGVYFAGHFLHHYLETVLDIHEGLVVFSVAVDDVDR